MADSEVAPRKAVVRSSFGIYFRAIQSPSKKEKWTCKFNKLNTVQCRLGQWKYARAQEEEAERDLYIWLFFNKREMKGGEDPEIMPSSLVLI